MNPTMDMDRYHNLGPDAHRAVLEWITDQLPEYAITQIDATVEGHVTIIRWIPQQWFEAPHPECPTCHGAGISGGIIGIRQHHPVTTPPPWTHPNWNDQR